MWWRWPAKVQTERQNEEERWFNWLWTWFGYWYQEGWSECFRNCDFPTQPSLWSLVNVRVQKRMDRLLWAHRKETVAQITTHYSHRTASLNAQHAEADRLQQQKATPSSHSCQLRTGHWGYDLHGVTKTRQWNIRKMSPHAMSLLQNSDDIVRIWCKQHNSMDPSCFVSTFKVAVVV